MSNYTHGSDYHPSYGTLAEPGLLMPVLEAVSFFGRPIGPMFKGGGYPSPRTLPDSIGGGAGGYGASGGASLTGGLLLGLAALTVVGILIVHHLHWRE